MYGKNESSKVNKIIFTTVQVKLCVDDLEKYTKTTNSCVTIEAWIETPYCM